MTATATMADGFVPALVLFGGDACGSEEELACGYDWGADAAVVSETLAAGQYFLVVDSGDSLTGGMSGPPMANHFTLTLDVAAPGL